MDQRNCNEEFIRLFLPVERRIYVYIRSLVFNRTDAEDLLQEVATTLWRNFDQFEPGTHFDRWALKTAYNQVRYFRQKHHRNVLALSEPLFEAVAKAAEQTSQQDEDFLAALLKCMEKLDLPDRRLIEMWNQPGATAASVARLIGRSRSTVSRTLNRIQQTLLRCIRRTMDDEAQP